MKRAPHFHWSLVLWLLITTTGCSITRFAVDSAADAVVPEAVTAIMQENDLEFIKDAIPGNVKLLEGILKLSPDNKQLNEALSQSFLFYALAFVEEDFQQLKDVDPVHASILSERAKKFYLRGRKHGLQTLVHHKAYMANVFGDFNAFEQALVEMEPEDVPGLVYSGMNWLLAITHSMDSPRETIHIGRIKMMIEKAVELDRKFFFGLPLIAMGAFESSIPPALGGRPDEGKKFFEEALVLSERKFLLAQVMYAERYAVQMLDEELFVSLLNEVLQTPDDVLPNYVLPNVIAKTQAKRLISQKDNLF
ncbi:MAG: hypothetical protein HQM11_11085 [SAR324 cluster bacterium]|nr:hypothetical protein [SAR324 cluster bacterium]